MKNYILWIRKSDGWLACCYILPLEEGEVEPILGDEFTRFEADSEQLYNDAVAYYNQHTTNAVYSISEIGDLSWSLR